MVQTCRALLLDRCPLQVMQSRVSTHRQFVPAILHTVYLSRADMAVRTIRVFTPLSVRARLGAQYHPCRLSRHRTGMRVWTTLVRTANPEFADLSGCGFFRQRSFID